MDGRDVGTTVFPHAELKIYVNASAETRARRRFLELTQAGSPANYEEVLANVVKRDHIDQTRAESPLRRADDAIDLDNSNMTIEEQNQWLLDRYNEAAAD
jgi:cytidylate kinase